MSESCDRCPDARAVYCLDNPHGARLTFCTGCAQLHWPAMHARGWTITPLTSTAAAPQAA